jgi:putative Holliday junction resolvase
MENLSKIFTINPGEKILALDTGDQWVGSALSDATQTLAKPYKTVPLDQLKQFLAHIISEEPIKIIVVGHPRTMKGTSSEQTTSVERLFSDLEKEFPGVHWALWDERLSSKRASSQRTQKTPDRDARLKAHSIAAAYILDSYLTFLKAQQSY